MDSAKLNDWAQVVGIFALVASLVFVGLQLKQAQDIALSEANQARADSTVSMLITSAENPNFVAAFAKAMGQDPEPLTPEEFVAMSQYARALLYTYENILYQYENGFVPEHRWQASKQTMIEFLTSDYPIPMRTVYEMNRNDWDIEFQEVIDQLLAEAGVRTSVD